MTLSRFLRDFLYIPLGGNRKGKRADLPQPDAHDGARRAVARRGVDVRALGRVPRRRAVRRARARRARASACRRGCAGSITFHLVVFGWILFRSQSLDARRRRSSRGCSRPGSATLWSVAGACSRSRVVIGLQLAARQGAVEGLQVRIERLQPVVLGVGLAVVHRVRRRDRVRARASPRSSTSASERHARHDDSLMNRFDQQRPAALPRARRASSRVLICAVAAGPASRAPSIRRAGEQMNPGVGRDARARASASRPAGSPTSCRSRTRAARRDRVAVARRRASARRRLRSRPSRVHRRRRPAGHRRTRSTPPRSATSRRRAAAAADAAGHRRLAVAAARRRARAARSPQAA